MICVGVEPKGKDEARDESSVVEDVLFVGGLMMGKVVKDELVSEVVEG